MDQNRATQLLNDLVAIPSLSGEEKQASTWLVSQMLELGYDRAYVDEAGSAVGEIGPMDAERTVVLMGHIDTVPGQIPVRIEADTLHGRGSVDAKGPLATFVCAAASLGSSWGHETNTKLVVVGATEEEAATSKGAHHIRDRYLESGYIPDACIIGEPSRWNRVTLGYKGRIQIEFSASRTMVHTAGPERGVAADAAALWHEIERTADAFNEGKPRAFDQLMPNLREIISSNGEGFEETVSMMVSVRTPMNWNRDEFTDHLDRWLKARADEKTQTNLTFKGLEQAWRGEKSSPVARAFLAAIRDAGEKPGFVVKTGTCDLNVVGPAWNCPILAYGPGDSSLDHTPIEHISLTEYWQAIQVLTSALTRLSDLLPRQQSR
jgi:LysW-gamma-L-lysine carboxypeptidase